MLSAGTCQLAFAFADSPHGGKDERTSDESNHGGEETKVSDEFSTALGIISNIASHTNILAVKACKFTTKLWCNSGSRQ